MSTFACVIWCSRPPNSERDITDTQSRYANRKSYITMNCRRAFQIWQITDIDKKESFTNVEIIPLPVLRYFILRPSGFGILSFLLVSVSLFRLSLYHWTLGWWGSLRASTILRAMSAGVLLPVGLTKPNRSLGRSQTNIVILHSGSRNGFNFRGWLSTYRYFSFCRTFA